MREFINIVESTGDNTDARAKTLMKAVKRFAASQGVVIEFKYPAFYAPEIEITDLFANVTGQGAGTKVMTYLSQKADEQGFNILLRPSSSRNKEFYSRFGFENSPRHWSFMIRYPAEEDLDEEREPWMDHGDEEPSYDAWTPEHGIDNFVRTEFTCGGCAYLALALHEKTGWPIYAEGSDHDIEHIWVLNPEGKAVDINGVHPTDFARTKYSGNHTLPIFRMDTATLQVDITDPQMLSWAKQIVNEYPEHFGLTR